MPTDPTPAEISTEVEAHIGSHMKLCGVLGFDPMGYDSTAAQTRAADEIERLRRQRDELLSILKGISRQTAEVVKAHS